MVKNLKHGVPKSRLAFLREVPMFAGFDDKELARIDQNLDDVDLQAGYVLTHEGASATEAFIVESGTAEIRMGDEVIGETQVGEIIGEIGLINATPRTATVTATTPMRVLAIRPSQMRWLFEDKALAQRIRANMDAHLARRAGGEG